MKKQRDTHPYLRAFSARSSSTSGPALAAATSSGVRLAFSSAKKRLKSGSSGLLYSRFLILCKMCLSEKTNKIKRIYLDHLTDTTQDPHWGSSVFGESQGLRIDLGHGLVQAQGVVVCLVGDLGELDECLFVGQSILDGSVEFSRARTLQILHVVRREEVQHVVFLHLLPQLPRNGREEISSESKMFKYWNRYKL